MNWLEKSRSSRENEGENTVTVFSRLDDPSIYLTPAVYLSPVVIKQRFLFMIIIVNKNVSG